MSQNLHPVNPSSSTNVATEEDVIDIKQIVAKVIQNWSLFAISILLCFVLAWVYWYYASPSWHVASKVLVKNSNSGPQGGLGGTLSGDGASLFNSKSSADNEIQVLKSRTLMEKTVLAMQLNVKTFLKDGFKRKEIYEDAPFTVGMSSFKADTVMGRAYNISINDDLSYNITNSDDDIDINAKFGDSVKLRQYNLVLNYKPGFKHANKYEVVIQSPDAAVSGFSNDFNAVLSDKQATTIDLTFTYTNPAKGEAILDKIMELYLSYNLQNEKQIADSTIAFIDSRIILVSRELNNIEKQFEQYKTQNNLANISEQSKALVSSASNYYDKLAQQEIQLSIINDLEKYLNNPKNKNVIPSSLINPTDQSFGQAINSYNDLLLTRDKASLSYTEDNPVIENIEKQISNSRINLLRNIGTYKKTLQVGKQQLQQQNTGFTGQLRQLPNKERNYLDFSRQQNLKQELFLFLLQKREESAISRNSTISSSRIIDKAKSEFFPFKPKRSIIFAVALFLGILFPALYLLLKEMLNVRIDTKSDIERMTSAPIIGEIGHNSDKQSLVTGTNSRSVISEQFRSLRTNLQFVLDGSKSNVLLFTSSMSGEGKSFLSLNLGSALALTDKKVVFVEMDLRKPKLSESVGLTTDNGYTNYAISDNDDYDFKKLLKPLSFNKNCFLISSGPIPPNPAELLMNGKLEKLLAYLKNEFDYVIMDCAPVGLVTDALMLERHADLTFYVTRQGFTYKSQLNIVNDLIKSQKVKALYIVVNDIKTQKGGYSSYGQGYYGYGYGVDEQQTNWLSKFKFWK
jgi:tyrosine-protein kinase Etk/Wzc